MELIDGVDIIVHPYFTCEAMPRGTKLPPELGEKVDLWEARRGEVCDGEGLLIHMPMKGVDTRGGVRSWVLRKFGHPATRQAYALIDRLDEELGSRHICVGDASGGMELFRIDEVLAGRGYRLSPKARVDIYGEVEGWCVKSAETGVRVGTGRMDEGIRVRPDLCVNAELFEKCVGLRE